MRSVNRTTNQNEEKKKPKRKKTNRLAQMSTERVTFVLCNTCFIYDIPKTAYFADWVQWSRHYLSVTEHNIQMDTISLKLSSSCIFLCILRSLTTAFLCPRRLDHRLQSHGYRMLYLQRTQMPLNKVRCRFSQAQLYYHHYILPLFTFDVALTYIYAMAIAMVSFVRCP